MIERDLDANAKPGQAAFASIHTTSFPLLLRRLGISLLVSTYQAGRIILIRANGDKLNTHFRPLNKPMGIAASAKRLAVGTAYCIEQYRNVPEVANKLEPKGKYDACFLPCESHVTGNIDIHEMAWGANNELWFVNTLFSALCTMDQAHSFVPRWRPWFINALAPEDRCHLNGLGLRNGRPKYVTALGLNDAFQGWRERKAFAGILIDVDTQKIICHGLSMPHSPRWYANRLWILESGEGNMVTVNPASGQPTSVIKLPGFTRGLDFWGYYAFVGVSQVRETATFSDIPIIASLQERACGVWAIDLRSGQFVAFLKFSGAVQEIFAVQVLPNLRFPEILEPNDPLVASAYVVPDEVLADVPRNV